MAMSREVGLENGYKNRTSSTYRTGTATDQSYLVSHFLMFLSSWKAGATDYTYTHEAGSW